MLPQYMGKHIKLNTQCREHPLTTTFTNWKEEKCIENQKKTFTQPLVFVFSLNAQDTTWEWRVRDSLTHSGVAGSKGSLQGFIQLQAGGLSNYRGPGYFPFIAVCLYSSCIYKKWLEVGRLAGFFFFQLLETIFHQPYCHFCLCTSVA